MKQAASKSPAATSTQRTTPDKPVSNVHLPPKPDTSGLLVLPTGALQQRTEIRSDWCNRCNGLLVFQPPGRRRVPAGSAPHSACCASCRLSRLNRDVLVPRPAGRFLFGRLINRDADKLQILPLEAGGRQQVVANPPWIAVAARLVRAL